LHIAQIVGAIKKYHAEHDYVLCPHTACGVAAAEHYLANQAAGETLPVVCLATAHPAKFNDAVRDAIGKEPEYPPALEAIQSVCAAAIINATILIIVPAGSRTVFFTTVAASYAMSVREE
jgi:threonine synthase